MHVYSPRTVYYYDAIFIFPDLPKIYYEVKLLKEDFDLTDDCPLQDYLRTRLARKDTSIELTQPRTIERFLGIVRLDPNSNRVKLHNSPVLSKKLLNDEPDTLPRQQSFHYMSAVGCLSYIQAMIHPDITMAVQQCARFCNNPNKDHEEAVKCIFRYLLKTKDQGLILKLNKSKGLEYYVDADWAGSWKG